MFQTSNPYNMYVKHSEIEEATVCREMFTVEYFEFRELYTTRDSKNREDMGVVASKRHVDS